MQWLLRGQSRKELPDVMRIVLKNDFFLEFPLQILFFCPTLLAKATCSINLDHESYLIRTKQAHCSFLYSCLNQGPWLAKICFLNQTNFAKKEMRKMHKPASSGLQDAFLMKWQRDCEVWGLASCINETVSHDTLHRSSSSCLVRIFNLNLGWKRCRSGKRKGDWW